MRNKTDSKLQVATFGLGCFWHSEEVFRKLKGVKSTAVGFMGGTIEDPTYKDVCAGKTGHAEVVQLNYDPSKISYEELLETFWKSHNSTTLDRQGPDIGNQYRSAIFFHNAEQEIFARKSKENLEKTGEFKDRIVTEITSASTFCKAEEYHQKYLQKQGLNTCPS